MLKTKRQKRQFLRNAIECQFIFYCIGKAFLKSTNVQSTQAVVIIPRQNFQKITVLSLMKLCRDEQIIWIPFIQIRQALEFSIWLYLNFQLIFFRYDKLFVDNKLYVWSEVQGRVVEQVYFKFWRIQMTKISAILGQSNDNNLYWGKLFADSCRRVWYKVSFLFL